MTNFLTCNYKTSAMTFCLSCYSLIYLSMFVWFYLFFFSIVYDCDYVCVSIKIGIWPPLLCLFYLISTSYCNFHKNIYYIIHENNFENILCTAKISCIDSRTLNRIQYTLYIYKLFYTIFIIHIFIRNQIKSSASDSVIIKYVSPSTVEK